MLVRRDFAVIGLGLSALWFGAACGRQATTAASPGVATNAAAAATARTVGARCALSGGVGLASTAPGVFIELAGAQGDLRAILREHPPAPGEAPTTAGFEAFVGDPRLKSLNVHHLLTPTDVAQSVPWELEGRDGGKERLDITVTPHVNGPAPEGVSIEVDVRGRSHTTVVVHDQESVILGGFAVPVALGTQAVFVLTPYVVWNEADVLRLLDCKRPRAHSGAASVPALP